MIRSNFKLHDLISYYISKFYFSHLTYTFKSHTSFRADENKDSGALLAPTLIFMFSSSNHSKKKQLDSLLSWGVCIIISGKVFSSAFSAFCINADNSAFQAFPQTLPHCIICISALTLTIQPFRHFLRLAHCIIRHSALMLTIQLFQAFFDTDWYVRHNDFGLIFRTCWQNLSFRGVSSPRERFQKHKKALFRLFLTQIDMWDLTILD